MHPFPKSRVWLKLQFFRHVTLQIFCWCSQPKFFNYLRAYFLLSSLLRFSMRLISPIQREWHHSLRTNLFRWDFWVWLHFMAHLFQRQFFQNIGVTHFENFFYFDPKTFFYLLNWTWVIFDDILMKLLFSFWTSWPLGLSPTYKKN